jgi:hypothetical protein
MSVSCHPPGALEDNRPTDTDRRHEFVDSHRSQDSTFIESELTGSADLRFEHGIACPLNRRNPSPTNLAGSIAARLRTAFDQ